MERVKRIINKVKVAGQWTGKLNYNEITEIQKAGLFNMAKESGKYLVVDNPNKF